ncbi:MAG: FliH/SctL family protein [Melioribacteraceae bacterium]
MELGGCLIETEIGNVDARISTQLNEMQRQLEDSLIKKN